MINLNTQKLIWEQQIRNECTKYQIFIGDSNMPKYKINFIDNKNMEISYSMEVMTQKIPMILNVNMGFLAGKNGKHCQPTLYHEFTHMWDHNNLFPDKDQQERKSVLSLYTEYHASQIEFLRFMECNSVKDLKSFDQNDKFYEFDKEETVFEFYDERCQLLSESINNYINDSSTANYKAVIDSYMYVFGIKSIYDKYIDVVEFPKIDSIFHKNIMNIYPLLQDFKIEELWEILLDCSKILDNLHILNSLDSMPTY